MTTEDKPRTPVITVPKAGLDFVLAVLGTRCAVNCSHPDPFFVEGVEACAAGEDVDTGRYVEGSDGRCGWLQGWRAYDRLSSSLEHGGFKVGYMPVEVPGQKGRNEES